MHCILPASQPKIKSESDSKTKLALKSNLQRCSKDLQEGEWIYYKREDEKWKGPAKIIGIDGRKLVVSKGGLVS